MAAWIIGLPFAFIGGSGMSSGTLDTSSVLWTGLGGLIAAVITTPLTAIALVLAYFDLRVRKEGLDVTMAAAVINPPDDKDTAPPPTAGLAGIPGVLVATPPTGPVAPATVSPDAVLEWDINSVTPDDLADTILALALR